MGRLAVRNNNTGARLNLKILDIGSRAYQIVLFKFIAGFAGEKDPNPQNARRYTHLPAPMMKSEMWVTCIEGLVYFSYIHTHVVVF